MFFLLGSFFDSFYLLNNCSASYQCWRLHFHWGITSEYVAFVTSVTYKLPNFVTILIFCCLIPFLIFHSMFLLMFCIRYFNRDFLNWKFIFIYFYIKIKNYFNSFLVFLNKYSFPWVCISYTKYVIWICSSCVSEPYPTINCERRKIIQKICHFLFTYFLWHGIFLQRFLIHY